MIATLALAMGAILPIRQAGAETLEEALSKAYMSNPRMLAAQAALRSVDETVPQALAGWRPTVIANGDVGQEWNEATGSAANVSSDNGSNDSFTPRGANLQVTQPLYRGGRTVSETSQAENLVLAQRSVLTDTEQRVLLDAVTAYMDVLRDEATYQLTVNNEDVLRRDLEATQARYEVGELTKTDVAQAEARLADATSRRIGADGLLQVARARYAEAIGDQPGTL
ncbi:MAG: TolC family protein, partial [Dongiaceae bacterium]